MATDKRKEDQRLASSDYRARNRKKTEKFEILVVSVKELMFKLDVLIKEIENLKRKK